MAHIDPVNPNPSVVEQAVRILRQKGVLVFPTTGLYGLGADARCAEAIGRVFAIKKRPADKPVLVLLSKLEDIRGLVEEIPEYARKLMERWPGGITLVFRAAKNVAEALTGGTGKIGVRLPAHPVARALTKGFGGPITGTSANLSGSPAVASIDLLDEEVKRSAGLVLDAGPLAGGPGSTVVDVTVWPVAILRQGAVSQQEIERLLK